MEQQHFESYPKWDIIILTKLANLHCLYNLLGTSFFHITWFILFNLALEGLLKLHWK